MSDSTHELLTYGIAAAKAHEVLEARTCLERLMSLDPEEEEVQEAYYWLSEISTDPQEKRQYIESMLANNPGDMRARRKLLILDGKLLPGEVVDPDLIATTIPAPAPGDVDRFTCPNCGGRMTFTPDGSALTCEYCASKQGLAHKSDHSAGEDFALAMAQAQGHLTPTSVQTYDCQGCGASFILPAGRLTITCPHCGSAYVVKNASSRDYILPDSLIPFTVDENTAREVLADWFKSRHFDELPHVKHGLGVYLPAWLFDMGGMVEWHAYVQEGKVVRPVSGEEVVLRGNVIIPAMKNLPDVVKKELSKFNLSGLVPYDPRYLVDWTAETYQIAMGDASLDAREVALALEKREIVARNAEQLSNLTTTSANMVINTFRLILFPVWLTTYLVQEETYNLVINGQTASVSGDAPASGLVGWMKKIL